ncbi:MAG: peptidase [Proteobacteria bacterium]|nr:peptidase [Pseudomonadota bacterium]
MTYCVDLKISEGLVFLSDTRTNAGLDDIACYRKTFIWSVTSERAITVVCAGNLSITQGIITRINQAIQRAQTEDVESILNVETMYRVAELFSDTMRVVQSRHRDALKAQGVSSGASMIVGGQRRGGRHRLFHIYSAGNFIEATADMPYFQLGEHKYGKPILDRVLAVETPMQDALKAALVSMDSTLRSNLSVGMPLDLTIIRKDRLNFSVQRRIKADDPEFATISVRWSQALKESFSALPDIQDESALELIAAC